MAARDSISTAIRNARDAGRPAMVAYLTAGFPTKASFEKNLAAVASAADVIESASVFRPMADVPPFSSIRVSASPRVCLMDSGICTA